MRKLLVVLLIALAAVADAQQATNNTPVTRTSEDNYQIMSYYASADGTGRWEITAAVRDSGLVEIRRVTFSGPDATHATATAVAFNTAVITAIGGETGTDVRKVRARLTQFLVTQGYLAAVTVVP